MSTKPLNDDTDLDEAAEIDTSERVETRTSRRSALPTKEPLHLPAWYTALCVGSIAVIGILTHVANGPMAVHLLLTLAGLIAFGFLFSMSSKANTVSYQEAVIGFFLIGTGVLIGSAPSTEPTLHQGWVKVGLAPPAELQEGPKEEMLTREGDLIKPTEKVKKEYQIVVLINGGPQYVTEEGVKIDPSKPVVVYLQDRRSGATSCSIPFKIAQAEKHAEKDKEPPKAAKPEADSDPKAEEPKVPSRRRIDPIPLPQDVPPAADTVPPDSAAPAAKPESDSDPATPAKDPDSGTLR